MSDSTTNIPQVVASAGAAETVNALMDAASPAMLFARNAVTSTGLTWGYLGGRYLSLPIANGTLTLGASTTSYIVADALTGVVTASTGTTNWDDTTGYLRLYKVVTGSATVTSYEDHRAASGGSGGGGGGGGNGEWAVVTIDSGGEIDLTAGGNSPRVQLSDDVTNIVFPALPASGEFAEYLVLFVQDGTGGWTVTGWGSVTFEGGVSPTIDTTPGSVTAVGLVVYSDGLILGKA